jgi:hypothetical protein
MACLLVMLTGFIITNRPCYFRFSRIFLSPLIGLSGIPQGPVFGRLLFDIYIISLCSKIKRHRFLLSVNDTRYLSFILLLLLRVSSFALRHLLCAKLEYRLSQWPRGLRHELSSLARTLGSWAEIPLKAWMSALGAFILCLCCSVCR